MDKTSSQERNDETDIKNELTLYLSDQTLERLKALCRLEYRQPEDEISFLINAQYLFMTDTTGQPATKDLNKQ